MSLDPVSGEEFSRWMNEQSNFRARLELRMCERDKAIMEGLSEIKDHLMQLNGKTAENVKQISIIDRDMEALKSGENHIEKIVDDIKNHGCHRLVAHEQILQGNNIIEEWSHRKKVAVVGGLLGGGALMWPAITEISKTIQALLSHGESVVR